MGETYYTETQRVALPGANPLVEFTYRFLRSERATVIEIKAIMEHEKEREELNSGLVVECDDGFLLATYEDLPQRLSSYEDSLKRLYSRLRYQFTLTDSGEMHFSPIRS